MSEEPEVVSDQLEKICTRCSEEMTKAMSHLEEWRDVVERDFLQLSEMYHVEKKRRNVAERFIFSKELGDEYIKYLNSQWHMTDN